MYSHNIQCNSCGLYGHYACDCTSLNPFYSSQASTHDVCFEYMQGTPGVAYDQPPQEPQWPHWEELYTLQAENRQLRAAYTEERKRAEFEELMAEREERKRKMEQLTEEMAKQTVDWQELRHLNERTIQQLYVASLGALQSEIVSEPEASMSRTSSTSGKELQVHKDEPPNQASYNSATESFQREVQVSKGKFPPLCTIRTPVPFPLAHVDFDTRRRFSRMVEIYRKHRSNLPYLQTILHIPEYSTSLLDLTCNKSKLGVLDMVDLSTESSVVLRGGTLPKSKNPENFSIDCQIGGFTLCNVLCDIWASVNLMPLSLFNHIGFNSQTPTSMTLKFADGSILSPEGIVEDVLVRIGNSFVPADFIVIDIKGDRDVSLILGRPFLVVGNASINLHEGNLSFRVGNETIAFDVFDASKYCGGNAHAIPSLVASGNIAKCILDPSHTNLERNKHKSHLGSFAGSHCERSSRSKPIPYIEKEFAKSNPSTSTSSNSVLPLPSIQVNAFSLDAHTNSPIDSNVKIIGEERQLYETSKLTNKKVVWKVKDDKRGGGLENCANYKTTFDYSDVIGIDHFFDQGE